MLEKNSDKIKIVFKHMPLRGRELSDSAALASFAAAKQGKFWEYHDEVFATGELTEESLERITAKLGLNASKLNADKNSAEVKQRFALDAKEAQDSGVRGTPTVFINGKRLKNRSLEGFQTMIDKELAKSK